MTWRGYFLLAAISGGLVGYLFNGSTLATSVPIYLVGFGTGSLCLWTWDAHR